MLVLVLESTQYSNPAYWSASSREPLRSTIGIVAAQTAIEYEYRCTEYRCTEHRFTEHEYDEIRCEALTLSSSDFHLNRLRNGICLDCISIL